MAARTARRGIESSQRLGRYGWRVERPLSWMSLLVPGLLASARLYGEQLPVLWRLVR